MRCVGYTSDILEDAQAYADHAMRAGRVEVADVECAVQARSGWEFGEGAPKDVSRGTTSGAMNEEGIGERSEAPQAGIQSSAARRHHGQEVFRAQRESMRRKRGSSRPP